MKKFIVAFFCLLTIVSGFSQTSPKRIKIILLGTFHFNQSLDSNSRLHSNLFSAQRQKEVDAIVNNLVKQKPDKIFLEFTPKDQSYYDSIYSDYVKGKEPQRRGTKANEYFQLGMKTAKRLGLKGVIGMNYQPQELADTSYHPMNNVDKAVQDLYKALDKFDDSTRINESFYDLPYPIRMPNLDSMLQKVSLSKFILYLNTPQKLQRDDYTNWNFIYSVGEKNMSYTNYLGTFWYGTNVRNFNNVLRHVDYKKDNCYLIIYGSSHIPFLKFLFQLHPYFEVIDLNEVLK